MDLPPPLPAGKSTRPWWLFPMIIVAGIAGVGWTIYLVKKTVVETEKRLHEMEASTTAMKVRGNLSRILMHSEVYFRRNANEDAVSAKQLQRESHGRFTLRSICGESYDDVIVNRNSAEVSVSLPDGRTIRYRRGEPLYVDPHLAKSPGANPPSP